jgi:anti-sigma28 factor (negative regulator of flagellin synthesis)
VKVPPPHAIEHVERVAKATPVRARTSEERVSVDDSRAARATSVAKNAAAARRAGRIEELKSAVRQGTYRPDPSRIAEEILRAAELEAQLRSLLP